MAYAKKEDSLHQQLLVSPGTPFYACLFGLVSSIFEIPINSSLASYFSDVERWNL